MTQQETWYRVQSTDPENRNTTGFKGTHAEAVRISEIAETLDLGIIVWDPDGFPVVPGQEECATPQEPMFSAESVVWNTPEIRRPVAVEQGLYVCNDGSRWEEVPSEWPDSGKLWQERKPIPGTPRDLDTPDDYTGGRIVNKEGDSQ